METRIQDVVRDQIVAANPDQREKLIEEMSAEGSTTSVIIIYGTYLFRIGASTLRGERHVYLVSNTGSETCDEWRTRCRSVIDSQVEFNNITVMALDVTGPGPVVEIQVEWGQNKVNPDFGVTICRKLMRLDS